MMGVIGVALKVAQTLGGVSAAVGIGEAVLSRTGVIKPETRLLPEAARFACDVIGVPVRAQQPAPQLAGATGPSQSIGDASSVEPRVECPQCHISDDTPILGAAAGEEIILAPCEHHAAEADSVGAKVGAMYSGWLDSLGIAEVACGPKPRLVDYKKPKRIPGTNKVITIPDAATYYKRLVEWQECAAKDKEASEAAAKAKADSDAAVSKKTQAAQWALKMQAARSKKELDDLKAAQAAEKDAAAKAEYQAKIDQLMAEKANAEKLAAEMATRSRDDAMRAKIDALAAIVNAQAQKPGGMSEFLAAMVANQQQQIASVAQQQSAISQQALSQPGVPLMVPASADPGIPWTAAPETEENVPGEGVEYNDGSGFYFAGLEDDAEMDDEIAANLGIEGAHLTNAEARPVFGARQAGWSKDELAELVRAWGPNPEPAIGGCAVGSCGVR